jgi:hypothetical protein
VPGVTSLESSKPQSAAACGDAAVAAKSASALERFMGAVRDARP